MASPTIKNINFVVDEFNNEVQLTLSATLESELIPLEDADCTAVYVVDVSDMRQVFKFQTDSSDIDADLCGNDITYTISANALPYINFAHARTSDIPSDVNSKIQSKGSPIASNFSNDRSLLKHDYIRYLAKKLFNTHFGVDLFNNEQELKDELVNLGTQVLDNLRTDLTTADGNTNATDTSSNIGFVLMQQIAHHDPDRLRTDVDYGISETNGVQSIPLLANDTIVFNVKVNAAEGQHNLTGLVDPIPSRTYRIVLLLQNSGFAEYSNVTPTDVNFDNLSSTDSKLGTKPTQVSETYVELSS